MELSVVAPTMCGTIPKYIVSEKTPLPFSSHMLHKFPCHRCHSSYHIVLSTIMLIMLIIIATVFLRKKTTRHSPGTYCRISRPFFIIGSFYRSNTLDVEYMRSAGDSWSKKILSQNSTALPGDTGQGLMTKSRMRWSQGTAHLLYTDSFYVSSVDCLRSWGVWSVIHAWRL